MRVVSWPEVEWSPLNPARGSQSPEAGALWGDRTGTGPSGFLVRFADGFASPPHIHNVSYRGVVITGLLHNDDPTAEEMWMPTGSFWTQPAGEVHVTAAQGQKNVAYIEIERGPYLVRPPDEAFDRGARPVNVHESNLVWVDPSRTEERDSPRASSRPGGARVAFLWGDPQPGRWSGRLVALPAGFTGEIRSRGSEFRVVVIEGRPGLRARGDVGAAILEPGSHFGWEGASALPLSCESNEECVLYVRTDGEFEIPTAPAGE